MVRAILDGRKTQTRRAIKAAVLDKVCGPSHIGSHGNGIWDFSWYGDTVGGFSLRCPFGVPGDSLWVRETVYAEELDSGLDGVHYLADDWFIPIENTVEAAERWGELDNYNRQRRTKRPTCPSVHMPRWASRITLKIKRVWVERVQDISEMDSVAEGCKPIEIGGINPKTGESEPWESAKYSFEALWDSCYVDPRFKWFANPFVWCCEFEKE